MDEDLGLHGHRRGKRNDGLMMQLWIGYESKVFEILSCDNSFDECKSYSFVSPSPFLIIYSIAPNKYHRVNRIS